MIIEDVRDSIQNQMVIMTTYKNKGKLPQIMVSTMYKRRQDEAEAAVQAGIVCLNGTANAIILPVEVDRPNKPTIRLC